MPHELTDEEYLRYGRQILLPEIGEMGQQILKSSKILIVGLGGLGSPASLYLAAAGVGQMWLADGDQVDSSNLQRQILFQSTDRHVAKTKAAITHLKALNPLIQCHPLAALDANSLEKIVPLMDVVLDCSDNMATRQAVNASCIQFSKPLISAAGIGWSGQLLLVEPSQKTACYRCVFPAEENTDITCSQAGVIGPVVGMMGAAQALLTIRLLCDLSRPTGILQCFDARTFSWKSLNTMADPACPVCHPHLQHPAELAEKESCNSI